MSELEKVRAALEKIAGHRDYDSADHEAAVRYKRDEGLWSTDEYLADQALTALAARPSPEWRARPGFRHVKTLSESEVLVAHPNYPPVIYDFATGKGTPLTDIEQQSAT